MIIPLTMTLHCLCAMYEQLNPVARLPAIQSKYGFVVLM